MARFVCTFFGVGLLRPAPGTWGSLAALPMAWVVMTLVGPVGFSVAIVAAFAIGWWATARETQGADNHDPSEIVIDEVAGQWLALLPVSIGAAHSGAPLLALWPGWVAGFLLFRLFDIWKPGPVRLADKRTDALGVMLDDIVAGILAAVGVMALAGIVHGLFRI
ncbi:MAG: phosphatidylglycerophosphatase A [Pseudomonadota bacterium]